MTYVCELRVESDCKYLNDDGVHCSGNRCCAFCGHEITEEEYKEGMGELLPLNSLYNLSAM